MVIKSTEFERFPACACLAKAGIAFDLYEHEPVFTVEEGLVLMKDIPGHGTKNLFLRDKKGRRFFLVTVCEEKRVDLSALGDLLGVGRLSFASAERLKELLGVEPGSVTLLALMNDINHAVEFHFDADLYQYGLIQCHPLRNDATVTIEPRSVDRFAGLFGAQVLEIKIPTVG